MVLLKPLRYCCHLRSSTFVLVTSDGQKNIES